MRRSCWLLAVGCWLLLAGAAASGQNVTVSASVTPNPAGLDDEVLFTVEVRGDLTSVGEIEPPSTQGLALTLPTPQQSYQYQNINGQVEHVLTLTWAYRPLKVGRARIGAAQVPVGGQRYTTDVIDLDVVPQAQRPPPAAYHGATSSQHGRTQSDEPPDSTVADLTVRTAPHRVRAYVGEQVVVDYLLTYDPTSVQPRESQILGPWDAEGLWREELDVPQRATMPRQLTAGERDLRVVTVKRIALFPARAGALTVEPVVFEIGTMRGTPRRGLFRSPFFSDFDRETVDSEPVVIDAVPLPADAPAAFNGAVGEFTMRVTFDDRAVREGVDVGEPVEMEVELRGTGNVATLAAPDWTAPAGVAVYPPDARETLDRRRAPLEGRKVFTYTLVPQRGGRIVLPSVTWSFFDPDAEQYLTLSSEPVPLVVNGAAGTIAEATPTPRDSIPELLPVAGWQRAQPPRPLHQAPWFWAALGTPLLALLAFVALGHWREARGTSPDARRQQALAAAAERLDEAQRTADPRAACAEAERAVRTYLGARFGLPAQALTRDDLDAALDTERLRRQGLDAAHRRALRDVLAAAERVQYAPDQARAADVVVTRARAALEALHEATTVPTDLAPAPEVAA